jgi:hypothetical protein
MGGGGNSCGVASPVLRPPFIWPGRCEVAHRGIEPVGGSPASKRPAFTAIASSIGFETVGS